MSDSTNNPLGALLQGIVPSTNSDTTLPAGDIRNYFSLKKGSNGNQKKVVGETQGRLDVHSSAPINEPTNHPPSPALSSGKDTLGDDITGTGVQAFADTVIPYTERDPNTIESSSSSPTKRATKGKELAPVVKGFRADRNTTRKWSFVR